MGGQSPPKGKKKLEAGVIISFPLLIPRAPLIPIPKPMGYGIREGKKGSEVEDKNYYIKIKRHR